MVPLINYFPDYLGDLNTGLSYGYVSTQNKGFIGSDGSMVRRLSDIQNQLIP